MKIAAVLTCYNRKNKTKECLNSLFSQLSDVDVYLTDDGSNDGTSEMILSEFPQVNLFKGDGSLFWCRGMYNSWKEVDNDKYDYILWLNDDILLVEGFLDELILCSKIDGQECIVSGIVADVNNPSNVIYGGRDKNNCLVQPQNPPAEILKMNGNVVLIATSIIKSIGIIDPYFHHDLGDIEYGLRAQKNGIIVRGTTKMVAYGYPNLINRLRKSGVGLIGRFRYLYSPFGFNPNELFYLHAKYYSLTKAVIYYGFEIFYNLLPDFIVK